MATVLDFIEEGHVIINDAATCDDIGRRGMKTFYVLIWHWN